MKPLILVVDDQIGRPGPHQQSFLDDYGQSGMPVDWEFLFHTGQDQNGHNSQAGREDLAGLISEHWSGTTSGLVALVLLDVRFDQRPAGSSDEKYGFEILSDLRTRFGADLPIVILSSEGETKRAHANRGDADGYLPKEQLSKGTLFDRLATCGLWEDCGRASGRRLVGRARCFLKVLRVARQYASCPSEGLVLYGETGTGKTELAQFIHESSGRRDAPFLTWKVRRTNEELVKDELFGHWAGAFNNATMHAAGLVERAHGGTVFFDEIGDLTPAILQLLLETRRRDASGLRTLHRLGHFPSGGPGSRAVAEAERSVGGYLQRDHSIKVDVAFLAATNQNLEDVGVRERLEFRADYFEELGVSLTVPSLNERREDIPLVAEAVLEKNRFRGMRISEEAMEKLVSEDWRDRNIVALEKDVIGAARRARDFGEILPRHLRDQGKAVMGERPRAPDGEASKLGTIRSAPSPDAPGAYAERKVQYLGTRVDALSNALEATCTWEAGCPKYSVTLAVKRMLGRKVETTDALRLAREILGDVLEPLAYERAALCQYGLDELQARILGDSTMMLIGRYVRGEATLDDVNTALRRLRDC